MADNMQATPQSRPGLGALASLLKRADDFGRKPFGYDNPPVQVLSDLLGIPGTQRTLERLAYGEPLTTGAGQATRVRDDTVDALFNAPGPLAKLALATKGLPIGAVIKPKGGNWLAGSVEDALKGLKSPEGEMARAMERIHGARIAPIPIANRSDAINSWIDKTLTKYVKNDMATPEDPIRLMAEKYAAQKPDLLAKAQAKIDALNAKGAQLAAQRGVPEEYLTQHRQEVIAAEKAKKLIELREGIHYAPVVTQGPRERAIEHRIGTSQVPHGLASGRLAQDYETMADASIGGHKAGDWMANASGNVIEANPWLAKIPPESMVYEKTSPGLTDNLGFDHLVDELRNATNPESGLPKELLLDYEKLHKMTMPQIVDRVADINAWRAAQTAEANLAKANNPATVLHKDYPDKGFKWVELKQPPRDEAALEAAARELGIEPGTPEFEGFAPSRHKLMANDTLQDALRYEGDTMGHCVGGYCPDVAEGRSRIFSLRDANGKPYVTVETQPAPAREYSDTDDVVQQFWGTHGRDPKNKAELIAFEGRPDNIAQIKGYHNKAPDPSVLPYVQDFVKSGKWGRVWDLEHTGLRPTRDIFGPTELERFKANNIDLPSYLDDAERQSLQDRWYTLETGNDPATGLPKD